MAHHQLDELDEKILKLIIGNARMPFLEVARECNVSGAAIHQVDDVPYIQYICITVRLYLLYLY